LLVEDEAPVRAVISRALAAAGSTVLEADNGLAALAQARGHDGPIDLVVTDVVMALMGGPELVRRLRAERAGIRVLFISGYSRDAELPVADPEAGVDFVQKPFSASALVDRVSRLLSRAPPLDAPGAEGQSGAPSSKRP
jgi:two-component system cell cycle sensor histidine kinase/response regulator CckA